MCGITGILSPNSSLVTIEQLKKMTHALAHRGPDGEGLWINDQGNVSLGHRRLSILDLTGSGHQPMHYLNRYTIVHNGEIYNYLELKEELSKKGYSFKTKTDTEVMAAAFDCWQETCVDYFDGMFAFAIWDEKEKELFVSRDRFGEKPFYYYFNNNQFVFASEIKALCAAGITRTINRKMLFNFITIGYTDNPQNPGETFFENIYKLPAAHSLVYTAQNHELETWQYWDMQVDKGKNKIKDEEVIEKFTDLFQTAVKRRLRSDVEIGTSLSGGLDSSSIIATALPLTAAGSLFRSFTALFPGFEKDESVYAKQVADKFHLQQHHIQITEKDLVADLEKLSFHQEEPISSSSVLAQYKVYEQAKQQGVKVLLDGQGADETLAGYPKYFKWYWQELFMKRKLINSGEIKAAREKGIKESFGLRNIIAALFPDFASIFLEKKYLIHMLGHEDLTPEFIKIHSRNAYYVLPAHQQLNDVLYFNAMQHGLEELLRFADRNSMAHGTEIRLPFLSHELVEFLFTLPSNFKIRNGWGKWLLRESIKDKLPENIAWRKEKTGFEPPQKKWMQDKAVQQMIKEAKCKLVNEKILKPEVVNKNILPLAAYDADNYDWRYLSASFLFNPIT
ncbi:MAG TPA: asparagine synthase (glutamine-hydrolyzing) [Chitinophagaceae bacterium]|nr:asparagine synthase (glutamine-hydrolyzing) [Chitinophagaceae bacterium]